MLMTSMIDVIFILLAFFICVTELKKGQLDVDVPEVPTVEQAEPEEELEPIVIEVSSEDLVYVDGAEAANERMHGEQQLAKLHMEKNLAFLGTVGNNAPFVGLLGTVIGIIRELKEEVGQPTAESPDYVAHRRSAVAGPHVSVGCRGQGGDGLGAHLRRSGSKASVAGKDV